MCESQCAVKECLIVPFCGQTGFCKGQAVIGKEEVVGFGEVFGFEAGHVVAVLAERIVLGRVEFLFDVHKQVGISGVGDQPGQAVVAPLEEDGSLVGGVAMDPTGSLNAAVRTGINGNKGSGIGQGVGANCYGNAQDQAAWSGCQKSGCKQGEEGS